MHYTDRRRAKVTIGLELQARGWTLYGYSEDRSDAMTDYYAPATWDGIAERDGYVVVVDASGSTLKRSGGYDTTVSVPGEACPRCHGSGEEPDCAWTLESARADPVAFHRDRARREGSGGVPLFPHVVSPLLFHTSGYEKCIRCHGAGHLKATRTVRVEWPTFQKNPDRKKWHVEHAGRILESGIGLGPCADYDKERAAEAVNRIVDRIEAATRRREGSETLAAASTRVNGVTIRRNLERAGVEVVFQAKPDESVRAGLKRLGFRWSGRQGLWYARYSVALWDRVHQFLALDDAGVWQQPEPVPLVVTGPTTREDIGAEAPQPNTIEQIIAEAVELDAVIQASDRGVPAEIADRLNELRGLAFRLDPGIDLEEEIRCRRAYDVPKLVQQWRDLTRRLEREHEMRSNARTKNAHLGKLAQNRDQVLEALRIVVHQARKQEGPIPSDIQRHPDLARILLGEPEAEAPETLTRSGAQAVLDETTSRANNPAQTLTVAMLDAVERVTKAHIVDDPPKDDTEPEHPLLDHAIECLVTPRQEDDNLDAPPIRRGANRLDEILARVSAQRPIIHVDQILSPRLNDEQERHAAAKRERSRQAPTVLMILRSAAHGTTGQRMASRGWWWNGDLQAWQHYDADEDWLTTWYLEIGDQVSGVYDAVAITTDARCDPPVSDSLDVDGVAWRLKPTPDGRPVWTAEGKKRRLWSVTRYYGSGTLAGKSWWTVQTEVDDRPVPLNTRVDGTGEGPLYALPDDEEPSPPTNLLRATTELLRLDYPSTVTLDDVAWKCELRPSGEIRYETRRDPWWCFYVEGRPGDWAAYWHKPGDIGTLRCLTEEKHGDLEGEQNPLAILEMLTGYIRQRGGPPPLIEVSCAEIVPRETGGWDCYPVIPDAAEPPIDEVTGECFPTAPLAPAITPVHAHSSTAAYQYSLF